MIKVAPPVTTTLLLVAQKERVYGFKVFNEADKLVVDVNTKDLDPVTAVVLL